MNDPLEEKIDKLTKTVEEDHKMIRSLYIRARIGSGLRIFYWVVIVAAAVGSYYFIQPYVKQLEEVYSAVKNTKDSIGSSPFLDFFKAFGEPKQ